VFSSWLSFGKSRGLQAGTPEEALFEPDLIKIKIMNTKPLEA